MEAQSQIKRRLSEPTALAEVQAVVARGGECRTGLARHLCARFGFYDARGQAQTAGCLKALGELSRAGHLALPAPRSQPRKGRPQRLLEPVPAAKGVPDEVGAVQDLELVVVDSDTHMRLWNELMLGEHPCGAGPLVGPQLRYLIGSAHGWLGALGFSAAEGGLVCADCLDDSVPVTPEAVAVIQDVVERPLAGLRRAPPSAAVQEALRHVYDLHRYHTGARLRALRFARSSD